MRIQQPLKEGEVMAAAMQTIKGAATEFIGLANIWYGLDFAAMQPDELNDTIYDIQQQLYDEKKLEELMEGLIAK